MRAGAAPRTLTGMSEDTPAGEVNQRLRRAPRWTLAVAESLTGGRVQALLTAGSGASEFFAGGVTAYTLEQKVRLLGVNRAHARRVKCVSQRVAVEMAAGACALFGTDLAVATTGCAEPAAGVPDPMAWWALCHRRRGGAAVVRSGLLTVPGADRVTAQEKIAAAVVGELAAYLREGVGVASARARRR